MTQPWTEFLAEEGARITDLAVQFPDAPLDPAGCHAVPLLHLACIGSRGADTSEFLHNLLSNDVKHLAADGAAWNSLNTPKGRMLASLLMHRDLDGYGIVLSADIAPAILKRLSMYVLRSKVKLALDEVALIGLCGAGAADVLAAAGIAVPPEAMRQSMTEGMRCVRIQGDNYVLITDMQHAPALWLRLREAGATPAGTERWQLAMIRAGLPLVTAATQEEFVPQMLNFELIGGVSFNKGCYPGQEIVARTQYLGKLKKRMYRVQVPAGHSPRVGEDVYTPEFGEQSAGKVVNVAPTTEGGFEALAVMQTGCAEAGEVHLGGLQGPRVEFLPLPYALS
ncbi:MAG: folate-binding protein [Zoogloeaceae bacterium]|nr:folate-binding protein [Zoogloeaceae bacterium]